MSVKSTLEKLNQSIDKFIIETNEGFKELKERFKETDERFKRTDERFKRTDERFKRTDERINKLLDDNKEFKGNWGKFVEALIRPSALKLFKDRGIKVTGTDQRNERYAEDGDCIEIDILVVNVDVVIPIEVKTTLKVKDVNEHIEKRLKNFHKFFPEYRDKRVYGAVAYINREEEADKYAYRKGLFVITLSGEGLVVITNDLDFNPKDFGKDV
ncbi:hypothetical protein ES703_110399 [subsurface metagenome]